MAKWNKQAPEREAVIASLVEPNAQADLQGRLFVDLIERGKATVDSSFKLANAATLSFAELPFEEAVKFWESYGGDPDTLQLILRGYRESASENADLFFDALSRSAVAQLQAHIEAGGNIADFIEGMRNESVSFGIEPASPSYLENVYRTNIATAYNQGRRAIIEDPATLDDYPYVQFVASGDSRTRESHQALSGLVFRVGSDLYNRLQTPLAYQCRCSLVSVAVEEFEQENLKVTESLPASMIPPGF